MSNLGEYSSAKMHVKSIKTKQETALRIINYKNNEETKSLFKSSNILPFEENFRFIQGKFLWRVIHLYMPDSVLDIFKEHDAFPTDRMVNKVINRMNLPYRKSEFGKKFITFDGLMEWNKNIPNHITSISTSKSFKDELKKHLLSSI